MNTNSKIPDDSYDLFISYGRGDDIAFVEKLYNDLSDQGYKVWFDSEKLESNGRSFLQNIRDPLAINQSMRLLLVVGPHASKSEYVRFEWEFALANCIVVIPLLRMGDEKDEKGLPKASKKDYDWIPESVRKRNFHAFDFRMERLYEDAFEELLNNLSKPILPLCKLDLVPNKPANFIIRNNEVEKIKQIVLGDSYKPGVITSVGKSTAVQGMGGIGKSVLAASLCHDCDVRRSFSDGVYWVTVGDQQAELNVTKAIQKITGDYNINLSSDVDEAKNKLRESLKQKNCLIILDDVWKQQDIEIFPSDEALRSRLLITTRNKQAVEYLSSNIVEVSLLNKEDAQRLLAKAASNNSREYTVAKLPSEADEIIKECGYLPLAIAIAGGMISGGDNKKWITVLKQLKEADLTEISKKFPDYPYPNLYRVLDTSVKALEAESKEEDATRAMRNAYRNYLKLAIFKEDTIIPKSIIELIWRDESVFDTDTDNLLDILVARSLIQRNKEDNYTLHDLQLDYLKKSCTDIKQLNKEFLDKLGDPLNLTDKYAWNNYIWHLVEAGEKEAAIKLLADYYWIESKLTATGNLYKITSDYQLIPFSEEMMLIQKALLLGSAVITDDPAQLPHQLYGRLGSLEHEACRHLAAQCMTVSSEKSIWLNPLTPQLEIPDLHKSVFRGHSSAIKGVLIMGNCLVSWSTDGTLRSWDIYSGKTKQIFSDHSSSVLGAFKIGDDLISWSFDNTIRLWDIDTGITKNVFEGNKLLIHEVLIHENTLISWSLDGTLRSWDILSGKAKHIFEGHFSRIKGVCLFEDILMAWSDEKIVHSWDIKSGDKRQVFEGHSNIVRGLLVFGETAASWCWDCSLIFWNINSGKIRKIFHQDSFPILGAIAHGTKLIGWDVGMNIQLWDTTNYTPQFFFEGPPLSPIRQLLAQGEFLIAIYFDNTIRLWDITSGKLKQTFEGHSDKVNGALVLKDKTLVSWSDDHLIHLFDIPSGRIKQIFEGHSAAVSGALIYKDTLISWSDDRTIRSWNINSSVFNKPSTNHASTINGAFTLNNTLTTWSKDNTIRTWDIDTGKLKQIFEGHTSAVNGAILKGKTLISWSNDHTIRSWDIRSGRIKRTFEGHTSAVEGVFLQRNNLISWSNKQLFSWHIGSGEIKKNFEENSYRINLVLIQDHTLISWQNDLICSWHIESGKVKRIFENISSKIIGILIDGDTLFSWGDGPAVRSWEISSGLLKHVFEDAKLLIDKVVIQGNTLLCSGLFNSDLHLWDISTGKKIPTFTAHTSMFISAYIQSDKVISMSLGEIIVWNHLNGRILSQVKGKRFEKFYFVDGYLYIIDESNTICIYQFPTLKYIYRYTLDSNISAFQIAKGRNRIILGDASGRLHFLEPVGFRV